MTVCFRSTAAYRPGSQKMRLFSDRVVLSAALIAFVYGATNLPMWMFLEKSRERDVAVLFRSLFIAVPLAVWLAGGMPRQAYAWYSGFCLFSLAGAAPVLLRGPSLLLFFLVPAVFCFHEIHRTAPHILEHLGYIVRAAPLKEIAFAAIISLTSIGVAFYTLRTVLNTGFALQSLTYYIAAGYVFLLDWGVLFGVMYGMMMRRLSNKQFEAFVPITIIIVLVTGALLPGTIDQPNHVQAAAGVIGSVVLFNLPMGLAFQFCRSSRMVTLAYILYSLFYRTMLG